MGLIKYYAKVTGDCAPYKWTVGREGGGHTNTSVTGGEADTFEQACADAQVAAEAAERKRRHAATVERVELFNVPETPRQLSSAEEIKNLEAALSEVPEGA